MLLRIVSIEWELYNGNIEKVSFPTDEWIIGILSGHINIVTALTKGTLSYLPKVQWQSSLEEFTEKAIKVSINGWLAMVENDIITIAAE